jgi:uncharacterized membrane protein
MNAKTLKILTLLGKITGAVLVFAAPFENHAIGLYVFAGASILKDLVNRVGDLLDDGKVNQSYKGE